MLFTVILIITFSPEIMGAVVTEKLLDDRREGKGYADDAEDPVEEYQGGNLTITGSGGRFFNPQWDTAEGRQTPRLQNKYFFVTMRPGDDVREILFKIKSLRMMDEVEGECINDKLEFTGPNINQQPTIISDSKIPPLCGFIDDQTFRILTNGDGGPYEILLTVLPNCGASPSTRFGRQLPRPPTWNVEIDYVKYGDGRGVAGGDNDDGGDGGEEDGGGDGAEEDEGSNNLRRYTAPKLCLQSHTATSGTIKSLNYGGNMLNNLDYSICFNYEAGRYCGVEFFFTKLYLGKYVDEPLDALMLIAYRTTRNTRGCMQPSNTNRRPPPLNNGTCDYDYLAIGGERHCGDYTDYSVTAYGRSPMVVNVVSGMSNRMGEKGFYANYRMLRC